MGGVLTPNPLLGTPLNRRNQGQRGNSPPPPSPPKMSPKYIFNKIWRQTYYFLSRTLLGMLTVAIQGPRVPPQEQCPLQDKFLATPMLFSGFSSITFCFLSSSTCGGGRQYIGYPPVTVGLPGTHYRIVSYCRSLSSSLSLMQHGTKRRCLRPDHA